MYNLILIAGENLAVKSFGSRFAVVEKGTCYKARSSNGFMSIF